MFISYNAQFMTLLRPRHWTLLALCAFLVLGNLSCESDAPDPDSLPSWSYKSSTAPYSVEIPGQWVQKSVEDINRFAELAVHVGDQYYLIVIPQKLPQYEGVASPDALDLKRASIGVMKQGDSNFKVDREGPLQLGGTPALSVFATGSYNEKPVRFINTYATHRHWGFQVIAWGPLDDENGLIEATDKLLAGWQFEGAAAAHEANPGGGKAAENPAQSDDSDQ